MPVERRERQNLALTEQAWHLCNQSEVTKKSGWIPNLPWNVRISLRIQRDKTAVFSNLMKHINLETLKEAYDALDGRKALGVDGVSKEVYSRRLEAHLTNLVDRIRQGNYRPQPKREVLIPKTDGKTRPLAIACFEDKLVDWVISKILTAVHEPLFIRNSFGYRPSKSADGAIKACYNSLKKGERPYVVEIDFQSFFNTIPHRRLLKIIGKRIEDHRLQRLILRFLQSEVIRNGEREPGKIGTPQGGLMSPVLANIYLHEALDTWFLENWASRRNIIVRYADDAVFFFSKEDDASKFLDHLKDRVDEYDLTLHPEKTRQLKMNKASQACFDFLGFTFYWGKQGSRRILKIKTKTKTKKERLLRSIREFYYWCKEIRNKLKLDKIWKMASAKIEGHLNYYGYAMNNLRCNHFCHEAMRSLFKWLNRRSQKYSYTWEGFLERNRFMPLYHRFDARRWKQVEYQFGRTSA